MKRACLCLLCLLLVLPLFACAPTAPAPLPTALFVKGGVLCAADVETGEVYPLSRDTTYGAGSHGIISSSLRPIELSPDGRTVYYLDDFDEEQTPVKKNLYARTLGKDAVLLAENVSSFTLSEDGSTLCYTTTDDTLYLLRGGERTKLAENARLTLLSENGRRVLFHGKDDYVGRTKFCLYNDGVREDVDLGEKLLSQDYPEPAFYTPDLSKLYFVCCTTDRLYDYEHGNSLYCYNASSGLELVHDSVRKVHFFSDASFVLVSSHSYTLPLAQLFTDRTYESDQTLKEGDAGYEDKLWRNRLRGELSCRETSYFSYTTLFYDADGTKTEIGYGSVEAAAEDAPVFCFLEDAASAPTLDIADYPKKTLDELLTIFSDLWNNTHKGAAIYEKGTRVADFTDTAFDNARFSQSGKSFTFCTKDESGSSYTVHLWNSGQENARPLRSGILPYSLNFVKDRLFYTLKEGDGAWALYCDGARICESEDGLTQVVRCPDDDTVLIREKQTENPQKYGVTHTNRIFKIDLNSGAKTTLFENVLTSAFQTDNAALLFCNYDYETGLGDLVFYDGKEARVLSEKAEAFVRTQESLRIR